MPLFNVTPRAAEPRFQSGKTFAARNPTRSPYTWLGWRSKTGAMLLPHVAAPQLHDLLDAIEIEVLREDETLRSYIPARAPSPWVYADGEWWPGPASSDPGTK